MSEKIELFERAVCFYCGNYVFLFKTSFIALIYHFDFFKNRVLEITPSVYKENIIISYEF